MVNLIIGNLLSAAAAVFMAAANWSDKKTTSFRYQCLQCLILAAASVFFGSYAGVTTLLLCAGRNYLIAVDRYTGRLCVIFMILTGLAGVLVNNRGFIGLLPVAATVIYCAGSYLARRIMAVKVNILFNQIAWLIYEASVMDIVSAITDAVTLVILLISMVRLGKKKEIAHDLG